MFEQTFRNIDDVLWKEAGCATERHYEDDVGFWARRQLAPVARDRSSRESAKPPSY